MTTKLAQKFEKDFIKNGYFKFKLNKKYFNQINSIFSKLVKKKTKKNFDLKNFHKNYKIENVNLMRLYLFNELNKNMKFKTLIFNSAKEYIDFAVGSEICCGDANVSIQCPRDTTSLLQMHTDFFSGESLFQANLWFPFMDVKKTQSMFVINPETSVEILEEIKENGKTDFQKLDKKYFKYMRWINAKFGEALIFSPNILHGNVVNEEKYTRFSINIRFKNIYSPQTKIENEKRIGTFYKPLAFKTVTNFNLKYNFTELFK
tara:strand:- start:1281 stop:2063 length:783 start_codon:yes stop_codon:yes gene_type:complete